MLLLASFFWHIHLRDISCLAYTLRRSLIRLASPTLWSAVYPFCCDMINVLDFCCPSKASHRPAVLLATVSSYFQHLTIGLLSFTAFLCHVHFMFTDFTYMVRCSNRCSNWEDHPGPFRLIAICAVCIIDRPWLYVQWKYFYDGDISLQFIGCFWEGIFSGLTLIVSLLSSGVLVIIWPLVITQTLVSLSWLNLFLPRLNSTLIGLISVCRVGVFIFFIVFISAACNSFRNYTNAQYCIYIIMYWCVQYMDFVLGFSIGKSVFKIALWDSILSSSLNISSCWFVGKF